MKRCFILTDLEIVLHIGNSEKPDYSKWNSYRVQSLSIELQILLL